EKNIANYIEKASKITIPEKVYREVMPDDHGLLVVYLMDLDPVFRTKEKDKAMKTMVTDNGINTNFPLIGYAIGFPPISPDPGGEYVHGDYDLDDEDSVEEWDETLETNEE